MRRVFPFLDPKSSDESDRKRQPWDEILLESENFVVVPTVGALVEGWVLIVTRRPFLCMGALDQKRRDELNELTRIVASAIQECYGDVAVFEHGPPQSGSRIGCGVDHAHLHVLPATFGLIEGIGKVSEFVGRWERATDISVCHDFFRRSVPYLYVEQPFGMAKITDAVEAPSQLFRRVIAYQFEMAEKFDWRDNPMEANVISTFEVLSRWFASQGHSTIHTNECIST